MAAPTPLIRHPLACASVVIPALDEEARIAGVVRHALADPATAEVIVVDDGSIDDTAGRARRAGARVVPAGMLGKGAALRDGVRAAQDEWLVFLDGDLSGLRPRLVGDLVRPLLHDEADFVKARFGRSGGRVTELTARPLLKLYFPELAHLAQPLGGLVAARRSLLQGLDFEDGYGVDIGLLIDAQRAGARIAEVDIGTLEHDSQPLAELAGMADEVARVIHARAAGAGRLAAGWLPAAQRPPTATAWLDPLAARRRGRRRLLVVDADELLPGGAAGGLFRFLHREPLEATVRTVELRSGALAMLHRWRRAGFMLALCSDAAPAAAEVLRRRAFADAVLPAGLPLPQLAGAARAAGFDETWLVGRAVDGVDAPGLTQVPSLHALLRLQPLPAWPAPAPAAAPASRAPAPAAAAS